MRPNGIRPKLSAVGVLVALMAGLVFWIVAWSFGVKGIDAFLVTIAILVVAGAWQIYGPAVRQALGKG